MILNLEKALSQFFNHVILIHAKVLLDFVLFFVQLFVPQNHLFYDIFTVSYKITYQSIFSSFDLDLNFIHYLFLKNTLIEVIIPYHILFFIRWSRQRWKDVANFTQFFNWALHLSFWLKRVHVVFWTALFTSLGVLNSFT